MTIQEHTEILNPSNGQTFTGVSLSLSLFVKLTGIYAMWCSNADSVMKNEKLSLNLHWCCLYLFIYLYIFTECLELDVMVAQRLDITTLPLFVRSHANKSKLLKISYNYSGRGGQIIILFACVTTTI